MPDLIPSCAELRAQITLDRPTREDLERVHSAVGARAMAGAKIRKTAADAGRALLASEQREVDQHNAELGKLGTLAVEVEQRVPMDPSQRKMRFGSSRFPAAADFSKLQRLTLEHSTVDWLKAHGARGDYDVDAGWDAFARGALTDDWRAWTADFGSRMELAMSTAEPGGGYLVPDLMSGRVIDRLRSATPIFDAGAQTVPMTASTLDIPRITGDPTAPGTPSPAPSPPAT